MASSIISGAISLMLILISGYVIATGILTISEAMINTQKDVSALDEQILQSDIHIISYTNSGQLELTIKNTGTTTYSASDINKMDLYLRIGSGAINKYTPIISINDDQINKGMWDPGEEILVTNATTISTWAKFVTSNGVSTSTYID